MARLFQHEKQRGEAEAIRMLFEETGMVRLHCSLYICSLSPCFTQKYEDIPVDDAKLKQLDQEHLLMFGDLPMVQMDDVNLSKRMPFILHSLPLGVCFCFALIHCSISPSLHISTSPSLVHTCVHTEPAILEHIAAKADAASPRGNRYTGATEDERATARSLCTAAADLRKALMGLLKVCACMYGMGKREGERQMMQGSSLYCSLHIFLCVSLSVFLSSINLTLSPRTGTTTQRRPSRMAQWQSSSHTLTSTPLVLCPPPFLTCPIRLAVSSNENDLGLGSGEHFTFGDVA